MIASLVRDTVSNGFSFAAMANKSRLCAAGTNGARGFFEHGRCLRCYHDRGGAERRWWKVELRTRENEFALGKAAANLVAESDRSALVRVDEERRICRRNSRQDLFDKAIGLFVGRCPMNEID